MRILWLLPKWPYPDRDGSKKAHMALLKNWPKEHSLDLVIFSNEHKSEEEIRELKDLIGFNNLLLLPCSKLPNVGIFLLSLFSKQALPTTVSRFATKKAIVKWLEWSSRHHWDVLIFDVLHSAGLFF